MASKKSYLIKVWDHSGIEKTDKITNVEGVEYSNDGFDLLQEKVINCYETNIKNLSVPKGFRCTYEEIEEKKTTSSKKISDTSRPHSNR
jgi:hypothetical protein